MKQRAATEPEGVLKTHLELSTQQAKGHRTTPISQSKETA